MRRRRRQLQGDQLRLGGEPEVDRRRPHGQPLHLQRPVGVLDHHQARRRHDQRRADPRPARGGARQAHRRQHARASAAPGWRSGPAPAARAGRATCSRATGKIRPLVPSAMSPATDQRQAVGDRRGRRRRHQRGAGEHHRRDPGEQLGLPFPLVRQDGAIDDAVRRHREEAGRRGAVARRLLDGSLADPGPGVGVGLRVRHRHAGGDHRAGAQPDEGRRRPAGRAARSAWRRRRRPGRWPGTPRNRGSTAPAAAPPRRTAARPASGRCRAAGARPRTPAASTAPTAAPGAAGGPVDRTRTRTPGRRRWRRRGVR